jgi:1-pyrroline-5-carboxylate dehydrogenase
MTMKDEKKLTYVSLEGDESFHEAYEQALDSVRPELGRSHPLHIGDAEIHSGPEFEVRAPFDTRILVGKFQTASPDLIRSAILAANREFPAWQEKGWKERVKILRRTATILEKERFALAAIITYEAGKTRAEAIAEVSEAIDMIRYHAAVYTKNKGYVVPMKSDSSAASCTSVMRPHGTWAIISPFNFPLSLVTGMAAGALICGNTVLLKPTSETPFSCLKLYEAFVRAGVPPNAVHYLTGPGSTFGDVIAAHPGIDGIAFTGSRDVGIWIERSFSERQPYPKPVVAEMGSKNPVIVTAEADIAKAAEGVARSAFGYGGQKCSATSRVYVHPAVFEPFILALKAKTESLVVGDPRQRDVFMGPLIDAKAKDRFNEIVARTRRDGGQFIAGGEEITGDPSGNGYFVRPVIVTGLNHGNPLARKELFVPFLIVEQSPTLELAIREANDTDFGLTAGIFSENPEEVEYFFTAIQSGVVYANRRGGATTGAWPGMQPFGGWKASGSTGKGVGGPYYLLSYLREQARTWVREARPAS